MMDMEKVIDRLSTCEHCLFPFEKDCHQFLCGMSEELARFRACDREQRAKISELQKTVKLLEESNAHLRAQLSALSEEGKNGLDA